LATLQRHSIVEPTYSSADFGLRTRRRLTGRGTDPTDDEQQIPTHRQSPPTKSNISGISKQNPRQGRAYMLNATNCSFIAIVSARR
jgi:hypothetical protein